MSSCPRTSSISSLNGIGIAGSKFIESSVDLSKALSNRVSDIAQKVFSFLSQAIPLGFHWSIGGLIVLSTGIGVAKFIKSSIDLSKVFIERMDDISQRALIPLKETLVRGLDFFAGIGYSLNWAHETSLLSLETWASPILKISYIFSLSTSIARLFSGTCTLKGLIHKIANCEDAKQIEKLKTIRNQRFLDMIVDVTFVAFSILGLAVLNGMAVPLVLNAIIAGGMCVAIGASFAHNVYVERRSIK